MGFSVSSASVDEVAVIRASGDIDMLAAPRLREVSDATLDRAPRAVVFDLTAASFIDSSGLSILVGAHTRASLAGTPIAIACDDPQVLKLLRLTAIDSVVPTYGSLPEAIRRVTPTGGQP